MTPSDIHPRGGRTVAALRVLDLFSAAAGGWSLGLHRAGFTTMAACEAVDWRRALYAQNNPDVRMIYDDVRTLTAERLLGDFRYLPDVIVGSPPCQDISSANTKGKGVEGERSGLYFEAIRLVGECRPRWFAFENSANLRTRGADAVLAALEALDYACWPLVVRAGDIGANHERPRSWLIGCDLAQVADADGFGRDEGWSRWGRGVDLSVQNDPQHPSGIGHEGRWPWGHGPDGDGAASVAAGDAPDANGGSLRQSELPGRPVEEAPLFGNVDQGRNTPDPDQARQAHGCVEPGLRQAEIAHDGRGSGRGDDGSSAGQMGLCAPDRGHADGSGPVWSLADLADHIRVDDGLSARLAGTRIGIGSPKGTSAASLIVEAFGDSVVPQIPEAIGRAILRVEAAMAVVIHPQRIAA